MPLPTANHHPTLFVSNCRIASATSSTCVSSAKWPVSKNFTVAFGLSLLKALAPGGIKNGSFFPQIASNGGFDFLKYYWNFGYNFTLF